MPGTDSNSGRCSSLYHLLNSGTCGVSISTYTMKIPRPFCAMDPSPWAAHPHVLCLVAGTRFSRLEPKRDKRHKLGCQLIGHSPTLRGMLSAILRLIEASRNEMRTQVLPDSPGLPAMASTRQ